MLSIAKCTGDVSVVDALAKLSSASWEKCKTPPEIKDAMVTLKVIADHTTGNIDDVHKSLSSVNVDKQRFASLLLEFHKGCAFMQHAQARIDVRKLAAEHTAVCPLLIEPQR